MASSSWRIIEGDCVEAMAAMQSSSVDAVVCDPPYGLEFMGKEWDRLGAGVVDDPASVGGFQDPGGGNAYSKARIRYGASAKSMQEWHEAWAREALRVLRPGGHLLAFGGTRTYHRLACAVEDAGFEIRDEVLRSHTIDLNDRRELLRAWLQWSERVPSAGLTFHEPDASSAGARVQLATSRAESPAAALIAELASTAHPPMPEGDSRSAASPAVGPSTASSALVTIAGRSPASPDQTSSTASTAPNSAPEWLAASREPITRAAAALTIWLGAEPSLRPAATDALCAALTSALKHIICAHSETFRNYDTTWQTVCVSATTATTTESTAASLISFMADTLAAHDPRGGDATGSPPLGPLAWYYGSGFPSLKSLDVSKAIDKAAGVERPVVGPDPEAARRNKSSWRFDDKFHAFDGAPQCPLTAPATPDAERWQGWGTALKPAHEPIVMARKPLVGTVAGNVLAHGTGALNVDGCRIAGEGLGARTSAGGGQYQRRANSFNPIATDENPAGRWPANVLLDEQAAAMLDEQTGELLKRGNAGGTLRNGSGGLYEGGWREDDAPASFGDSGGASRFLYVAKASSAERSAGLDGKLGVCLCHEASTEDSPRRATDEPTGADDPRWSTSGSGSRPTDPFPTATKSTTETSTNRTTISPTSNSSPPPITSASTPRTTDATTPENGSDAVTRAENGSLPTPSTTTSAPKAGPSTVAVARATSHESSQLSSSAVCADCGGVVEGAWRNTHPLEPTVKPIDLMRWLVRLVTPPGGLVLDPFTGSGTTGIACALEGLRFVGIEREAEYAAIARARIAWWCEHPEGVEIVKALEADRTRRAVRETGQLDLLAASGPDAGGPGDE